MKKKTVVLILLILLVLSIGSYADSINVSVDGENLQFDVQPMIDNGRTLVPLRAIFEKLGADIEWDGKTQTITAVKDNTDVVLQIGNAIARVDGIEIKLDVPAKIVNGRTLVPVRFVSEAMGSVVGWDGLTKTVQIRSAEVFKNKLQVDMTWTKDEGPYIIKNKFMIPSGTTLTVEPGTEIYSDVEYLRVLGTLKANGSSQEPIRIIDRTVDKVGSISIEGKNCTFKFVEISMPIKVVIAPGFTLADSKVPSVEMEHSDDSSITGSSFEGDDYGIRIYSSDNVIVQSNDISNAYKGLYLRDSKEIDASKNTIINCEYGIISNTNWNSKFYRNSISGCTKYGIFVGTASYSNAYYENNFFENNMNALVDIAEKEFYMTENYWGTHKSEVVSSLIEDHEENKSYPRVIFEPFSTEKFDIN